MKSRWSGESGPRRPWSALVARACPTPITAPIRQRRSPGGKARASIVLVSLASPTDFLVRGLPARAEATPHPIGQLRRRSADAVRACRTDFLVRGLPVMVEGPRRLIADASRACRMGSTAPAKGRRASTNIRRKCWQGCIAPSTPLSGQTPGRISITSAATTITAPPNVGPICVSGTRSREVSARRGMKSTLEPSRVEQGRWA